jgi:hypothetical protein
MILKLKTIDNWSYKLSKANWELIKLISKIFCAPVCLKTALGITSLNTAYLGLNCRSLIVCGFYVHEWSKITHTKAANNECEYRSTTRSN